MFSVPEGRAANQPLWATTLSPPIGRVVARSAGQLGGDRLAGQVGCLDVGWIELLEAGLLLGGRRGVDPRVVRRAELRGQLAVVLARVLARAGEDLRGQQVEDRAVLIGRPDGAVAPQEAGAGALLAAEAERPVEQPVREPLEADRHLAERPVQALAPRGRSGCC